jgi:hypothetical protein
VSQQTLILSAVQGQRIWRLQLDNPTFLGWSVVAAYGFAALVCARAAARAGRAPDGKAGPPLWGFVAGLLLFLGINKQLNLQTLLIVLGRRAVDVAGWDARRRLVQAVFSVAFAAGVAGAGLVFARRWRCFLSENPLVRLGLIILAVFVVIRASTINHLDERLAVNLHDDKWCWILEICGSLLIGLAAIRFVRLARK